MPLFSAPGGQAVVILGLLCFERDLRRVWFVLVLNIVITLVWQVRSEWVGLALGILAWGVLTGRLGRVMMVGMAALAVLGAIEFADIRLPGRTGDSVSLSDNLARMIAPGQSRPSQAAEPESQVPRRHGGVARAVVEDRSGARCTPRRCSKPSGMAMASTSSAWRRPRSARPGELGGTDPHSVFYYALGYTGWVGVAIFGALQFAIARLLWRSYRATGQPVGLVLWVMMIARFSFEEGLETPFKAIPFYLLLGMAMVPALQARHLVDPRPARLQALPAHAR